jgi:WD40-like Beta Propeller Repeat
MRNKVLVFAGVLLVAIVGTVFYVLHVQRRDARADDGAPPVAVRGDLAAVQKAPHLVFRNTAVGDGFAQVAMVPLDNPGGARAISPVKCDRVYARTVATLCLIIKRGIATTYQAQVLNAQWAAERTAPLPGLPSRARISPDGSLLATTTFVFGDSYTNPGQFSTRTVVSRIAGGGTDFDLEQFAVVVDAKTITAADKNIWGVTFADDDTFYATAASGKKTWLVRGSLSQKRMVALREDVECPSLSPDGTRIAFKKHGKLPNGQWRLAVYDLKTHQEAMIAERRSVDDQVEWLDNQRILYGLPRGGTSISSDVWVANADGSGTPSVFVADAWSPAVVR